MKIFFIWLLFMNEPGGHQSIPTAFVREATCRETAASLNAQVGPHRGLSWDCKKQSVER